MPSCRPLAAFLGLLLYASPASAESTGPADFAAEIKLLARVVACAGDEPLPKQIDPKVVNAHCKVFVPWLDKYRNGYAPQVAGFFKDKRPADLPGAVVYPFGGGDLNTALTTYPGLTEATTMSLEHAGDVRQIRSITSKQLERSLALIRQTIQGLVLSNDSKSVNLSRGQRGELPGQLSFFVVGLALHDQVPVGLRYLRLNVDGTPHFFSEAEIAANEGSKAMNLHGQWQSPDFSEIFSNSELAFVPRGSAAGTPPRIHRHFAANLSDEHLGEDPSLLRHLEQKGPVAAMTKAASYLLWREDFSLIRGYLLGHATFMVSDSTGIPPRYAGPAGFTQTAYGLFQESFLSASAEHNAAFRALWAKAAGPLKFRYGYIDKDGHNHLLITARTAAAPAIVTSAAPVASVAPVALAPTGNPDAGSGDPSTALPTTVPAEKVVARVTAKDEVLLGRHWRLSTSDGAVHVWRPPGYQEATAGTVVYVHGYYTNVDQAWADHKLAEQFLASGRNALFIVPEATTRNEEKPTFKDLPALLTTVSKLTRAKTPDGAVVAMGHSGGFRSMVNWLGFQRLSQAILVDGLYKFEKEWAAWLTTDAGHAQKQLILVSLETLPQAERLLKQFPLAAKLDAVPEDASKFTRAQRLLQVVHLKSQYEHMALVTSGKVLPVLLGLTPISAVRRK